MKRHFRLLAALAVLAAPVSAVADSDISALVRDAVGLPMKPHDAAAGPWTLRTRDHTICTLTLSGEPGGGGVYGVTIPRECGSEIPPGVIGWKPSADGLALVGTPLPCWTSTSGPRATSSPGVTARPTLRWCAS